MPEKINCPNPDFGGYAPNEKTSKNCGTRPTSHQMVLKHPCCKGRSVRSTASQRSTSRPEATQGFWAMAKHQRSEKQVKIEELSMMSTRMY